MHVTERNNVLLEAVVTGSPVPEVEWLLDREPLQKGKGVEIGKRGNKHYVKLSRLKPENEGEYKIVAKNSVAEISFAAEVLVDDAEEEGEGPEVLKPPYNLTVEGDKTACFEIEAEGVVDLEWYYDGKLLEDTTKYDIDLDEDVDNFKFLVKNCNEKDTGTYEFVLYGEKGETTCSAKLAMKGLESTAGDDESEVYETKADVTAMEPKIIKALRTLEVNEGEEGCFEIKASGAEEVEWYHEGQIIESSVKYSCYAEKDTYKLVIKNCDCKDVGKYECVLLNEFSEVSCIAKLRVKEKLFAPMISLKDQSKIKSIRKGENLDLTVHVEGKPTPSVRWYREENWIKESERIMFEDKDGRHSMTIHNVLVEDSGVYRAKAVSALGTVGEEFQVAVQGKFNIYCSRLKIS